MASALVVAGILALFFALNVSSGIRGVVNRFAAASAVAALALNGALYAVDGVALKEGPARLASPMIQLVESEGIVTR